MVLWMLIHKSMFHLISEVTMGKELPIWTKYSLNVEEAAAYYGIGVKKLYCIIRENPGASFLLEVGTHYRIKRVLFEQFLNDISTL